MRRLIARLLPEKRAFSLIELLLTIVLVGIVSIPLSLLLSQHIRSALQSEDYTVALNLARLELEKVNNLSYSSINTASFSNYEGYPYELTRSVAYVQADAFSAESLKKITVQVYKSGSATVLASLITYIAKNVGYGL